MVFVNVLVNDHRDLGQSVHVCLGYMGEICVVLQPFDFGQHHGIVILLFFDLCEQLAEVEGLHVDAVLLHGNLIEADGLESRGSGADAAEIEPLHAIDNPTDGGKIPQILLERGTQRMYHMGLETGERHAILAEDVGHGELAAVGIAPVGKIQLADFIGIRLHQNGHACILQRGDGAVFVGKDRHGEDHAVILAFVLLEPLSVEPALVPGLHAAVAGQRRVHHDVVVACVGDGLYHIVPGAVDQLAGHEAAVAKAKGKRHFSVHDDFSFHFSRSWLFVVCRNSRSTHRVRS